MKFTKMHGAGNDFVLINNLEEHIPEEKMSSLTKQICTRRLSVGADGVMFVDAPQQGGDYRMRFYNADGSMGEMCGNGARCIARYGYEKGLAGEEQRIETTAGLVVGRRIDKRLYRIRLNDPSVMELGRSVSADAKTWECGYVELGDPGLPHAVVTFDEYDDWQENDLRELGRRLRSDKQFPKGANVTFCKKLGFNDFKAVTFERGVEDFTLACGTGCGSTASVMTLRGHADGKNVHIAMPGGDLYVTVTVTGGTTKDIFLTGPTNIVCEGELTDEDLRF